MPRSGHPSDDEKEIVQKTEQTEVQEETITQENTTQQENQEPQVNAAVEENKAEPAIAEDQKEKPKEELAPKGKKRERKPANKGGKNDVIYVPKGQNQEGEENKEAKEGDEVVKEEKKKREPKTRKPRKEENLYVKKGENQEGDEEQVKAEADGRVEKNEKRERKPRREREEKDRKNDEVDRKQSRPARRENQNRREDHDERDRIRNKNHVSDRNRNHSGNENHKKDGHQPKGEDKPANRRFEYPVGWREQAKKDVTLETKIPENPTGEALLVEPSFQKLEEDQDTINKKIRELENKRKEKIQEKKEFVAQLANKNSALIKQIKEKKKEADDNFFEPLKKIKAEKLKLVEQKKALSEDIEKTKSKYGGKGLSRNSLAGQLKELEHEHETTQLSAHLESKLLEKIDKVKSQFALIAPFEEKIKKCKSLEDKIKKMNDEMDAIFKKNKPISDELTQLRKQLDENKSQQKKDEGNSKKEGDTNEKQVRPKTEKEIEYDDEIKKLLDEIKDLYKKQKDMDKKFDSDLLAYDKQQFEINKLEEMRKFQAYLRRQEQRKKDDEEYAKKRQEQQEKELEALKFSYHFEISECNTLIRLVEDKLNEKTEKHEVTEETAVKEEQKVKAQEDPDLKPLIGKKVEYKTEESRVLSKKQVPKKKHVAEPTKRFFSDFSVITLFSKYEIIMPNNVTEAENTLRQLKEKVENYLSLRAKELEVAEKRIKEGGRGRREDFHESKPQQEEPSKPKRRPQKPHNETDFPEL